MKRILLALTLLASLSLDAQFVTTLARNANESQSDGVIYYLPRNVIRLEFTIEETDYFMGPYSEYATKMLGITDYVTENKSEFNIKNIDIQTATEIDPTAVYVIASDDKGKEPMPNVILDSDGLMLALGYDNIPAGCQIERKSFSNNDTDTYKRVEASFVEILDSEIEFEKDDDKDNEGDEDVEKPVTRPAKTITKEDKAKAAVDKIAAIRNAYYELISGAQEVSYGASTKFMANNLKSLENEYFSLFKGKIVKNVYKKVFYITPESTQLNAIVSIGKLTDKGENLKIQFDSRTSLQNINTTSNDVKNSTQSNKVFYRVPYTTNVKIMSENNVIAEKALIICQFGDIKTLSLKNNKALFNPNTGQIISITK